MSLLDEARAYAAAVERASAAGDWSLLLGPHTQFVEVLRMSVPPRLTRHTCHDCHLEIPDHRVVWLAEDYRIDGGSINGPYPFHALCANKPWPLWEATPQQAAILFSQKAADADRMLAERYEALAHARATITRLNRRCQLADAAVQTKCEDFMKRSTDGLRNFYFQHNRELADTVNTLEQETRALREALAQIRAAILEHEHCNSYDCGDCIGVILAASPGVRPAEEPQR